MTSPEQAQRELTSWQTDSWYVPQWLEAAVDLPRFKVLDTRSAQGRIETRTKTVTVADLILFHGHACDGLIRAAYALAALANVAFPEKIFDRTNLSVVSKNSPCLGDVASYLTGGRARFGTHRLDDLLGVGFIVREFSSGATWKVQEDAGFFPRMIQTWDAALIDDSLVEDGFLTPQDKAELVAVNEAVQWNWVRTELLTSRPAEHYVVNKLNVDEFPAPPLEVRRTDVINRKVAKSILFSSPYESALEAAKPSLMLGLPELWAKRYLDGPPLGKTHPMTEGPERNLLDTFG